MKRIAVFTGTRAEFGLLRPLIKRIHDHADLELQLIVSGMHLSPEFGFTVREVEAEFPVAKRVEMLLSSDTPTGICKSTGLGMIGLGEALDDLKPDLVVILGDRYETLAMATCAMLHRVPIAHLHGGELTEGALDDCIRHAITKMSQLHFTSTEEYRRRVIQLGENPGSVFCVGAIGLDSLKEVELLSREALETDLGVPLDCFFLVTFHPATLEEDSSEQQCRALLKALDHFPDHSLLFTRANADAGGRVINRILEKAVQEAPGRMVLRSHLGLQRYASAMALATAVVGNSSSGILEAPFFRTSTVDVGDRQKRRIAPRSVVHCDADTSSIREALKQVCSDAMRESLTGMEHPYGEGQATDRIMEVLLDRRGRLEARKVFFDMDGGASVP